MRLALLVIVAAACADDPGERPTPDDSWPDEVTWTWSFRDGGPCPADVTKAHIYVAPWSKKSVFFYRPAPEIRTTVPCARGAASVPISHPLGIQRMGSDLWLELATDDGRVFARSTIYNTRTEEANQALVVDVPRGWVHASWTLRGAASGQVLSCEDVPALATTSFADGGIELYASVEGDLMLQPSLHDCAMGEIWMALPPGTHELTLGAFATYVASLGEVMNPNVIGKVPLGAQTVTAGATTELGVHELVIADH